MGWLTGDLSGTRTGAVALTGHSERRDHNVNHNICVSEAGSSKEWAKLAPPPQMREGSFVFLHSFCLCKVYTSKFIM